MRVAAIQKGEGCRAVDGPETPAWVVAEAGM